MLIIGKVDIFWKGQRKWLEAKDILTFIRLNLLISISIEVTTPQFVDFGACIQFTWSSCFRSLIHDQFSNQPRSFWRVIFTS